MTPELFWTTLTLLLSASLWIPVIARVTSTADGAAVRGGVARYDAMSDATRRANRAHLNLLEQGLPFVALVLVAHLLAVSSAVTVAAAAAFFWLRLVHAAIMLAGRRQMPLRPIVFTLGWLCCVAVAVEILRSG